MQMSCPEAMDLGVTWEVPGAWVWPLTTLGLTALWRWTVCLSLTESLLAWGWSGWAAVASGP